MELHRCYDGQWRCSALRANVVQIRARIFFGSCTGHERRIAIATEKRCGATAFALRSFALEGAELLPVLLALDSFGGFGSASLVEEDVAVAILKISSILSARDPRHYGAVDTKKGAESTLA